MSIERNLRHQKLQAKAQSYIEDVKSILNFEISVDNVKSLMLFGTYAEPTDQCSKTSDCDLLIVVDNGTPQYKIERVNKVLTALERKYKYAKTPRTLLDYFFNALENTTGMFISHFICREEDIKRRDFARIFNVSKIMARVFAPSDIVMGSIASRSNCIEFGQCSGEIIKDHLRPKYRIGRRQLYKNWIMNTLTTLGSFIFLPIKRGAIKYVLEAAKWSLYSAYYYSNRSRPSLLRIVRWFADRGINKYYLERFMELRNTPRREMGFTLRSFFQLFKIHRTAMITGILPAYPEDNGIHCLLAATGISERELDEEELEVEKTIPDENKT